MARRWRCAVCLLAISSLGVSTAWAQDGLAFGSRDERKGADIVGAIADSFKLLAIEHAWRVGFQEKTRRELGGNFWLDYQRSVRIPRQWEDTDGWAVNYIGHPIHGAAAGYIWLDHRPGTPIEFSPTREYLFSRLSAIGWAASYSVQFELGPLSEASIGNVGMRSETTGWVDHVVTPLGAVGFIVAEDALDRYVVKWAEGRIENPLLRASIRIGANPARALSNAAGGRAPWYRRGRPLTWR